ncbi:biphenyl-2,3-diol 1,2-dioxygenase III [Roseivivax marinus]|uniref:Biphenyl-2,3-diol 1,2-dioxygenase III n=1 Tax=Roseivivax marinus TaxID=1379903 RepID=W4HGF1_9RHOB|nr:VOC family protein [Roseivivax marinus]ETW11837.1 biphenyl-2,3-diol 1,2-dioxygenase III [Roseivivax marinus]
MTTEAPAGMRIGHVHLKVSDLDRSIDFYQRVLGLKLMQRYGPSAAFLSAGGYHHHLGLNTWDSKGAGPAPRGYPGLFHTAFLFPDRKTLGEALARAIAAGIEISGAADHGVSEAVYFDDPDGNGVEIYRDRPEADWPRDENGDLALYNRPLDLQALLADAGVTLPA